MENDKRRMFVGLVRKSLGLPSGSTSCCDEAGADFVGPGHGLRVERTACCHSAREDECNEAASRVAAN